MLAGALPKINRISEALADHIEAHNRWAAEHFCSRADGVVARSTAVTSTENNATYVAASNVPPIRDGLTFYCDLAKPGSHSHGVTVMPEAQMPVSHEHSMAMEK